MKYTSKETALREYKEAKKNYLENMTNDNWVKFCDYDIIIKEDTNK